MVSIENWFNAFQRGQTSVFDEPHQGAPKTAPTEVKVTKYVITRLADCSEDSSKRSRVPYPGLEG